MEKLFEKMGRIRIIPQLDTYPLLVEFAKTAPGKVALTAVFSLFLFLLMPSLAHYLAPLLLVISLLPKYRHALVFCGTVSLAALGLTWLKSDSIAGLPGRYGLDYVWDGWMVVPLLVASVFALSSLLHWLARTGRLNFMRGFSAWAPFTLLLLFGLILSYLPMPALLKAAGWAFFFFWGNYVWFQVYSIQESRLPDQPSMVRQLAVYQPYWYPSLLPIPKGASFLARIECRDAEALAVCQLKALKLIMWAAVLNGVFLLSEGFFYGESVDISRSFLLQWRSGALHLFFNENYLCQLLQRDFVAYFQPLDFVLKIMAQGAPAPAPGKAIASTVFYFLMYTCKLAISTHIGVAICRMSGFYAPRCVYRPFESKSIADFFGRYYYYYRELLVTVFFYPVFFKFFKKQPKLRLFVATFAAACLGNTLFHLLFSFDYIVQHGLIAAALSFHTFAVYGLILTVGIFLSQLNRQKKPPQTGWLGSLKALLVIVSFYSFATIFANESHDSIMVNIRFLLAIFGIG
ncbi:MAG: hypothetical protein OET90_00435 [Desulfuromonadales bacterium]|nr:hypothetical protein [Desulfuromonadales bacterium]